MKLLLTSNGLSTRSIAKALVELVGKPASKSKIAFVPTAANTEPGEKDWLIDDLARIKKEGYSVDIVDISAIKREMWLPRLEAADVLFFGGGNTYHLFHWMRKSRLIKEFPRLLKRRVYAGISAGSIVTGPSLKVSSLRTYYPEDVGPDTNALGFVDFHTRPHLNSLDFPKVREKYLHAQFDSWPESVYALDDQTALKVEGSDVSVVGEKYLLLGGNG